MKAATPDFPYLFESSLIADWLIEVDAAGVTTAYQGVKNNLNALAATSDTTPQTKGGVTTSSSYVPVKLTLTSENREMEDLSDVASAADDIDRYLVKPGDLKPDHTDSSEDNTEARIAYFASVFV